MKRLILSVFACLIISSTSEARQPELRFLTPIELPNSGVKMKVMTDSAEIPLPTPMTATYEAKDSSGAKSRIDMYSPYELWIHDQHAGQWLDPFSNMLSLAVIKYPLPTGFKYAHAPREEYLAAADKLISEKREWTVESLEAWAGSYLKEKGLQGFELKQKPFKFSNIIRFKLPGNNDNKFAYAFTLNNRAAGQQLAPEHWFFVYIEANPGCDPQRSLQYVQNEFFGSIGVPRMSAQHKVTASSTFQAGKTTNLSGADNSSDEFKRSREVVKQSIANLKDWWFVETDNFIILSNLKTRYKSTLSDLQSNIENLRYTYELLMPPAKPISAVSVIRVPGSGDEYQTYVGPNYAWSGGIWMPARRELVIRPMEAGSSKQQKEQMLTTTYHEGFHQYLFYALDQMQAHPWFNEGHACFFEPVTLNNTSFRIGEHEYMAKDVDEIVEKKALNIQSLISMDYSQFYAGNDTARKFNYASAWLLVYYLRKHSTFEMTSPYASIVPTYYKELIKTRSPEKANAKAFEGINIAQLQKDVLEFWESRNMRVKARYNQLFKDYKPGFRR